MKPSPFAAAAMFLGAIACGALVWWLVLRDVVAVGWWGVLLPLGSALVVGFGAWRWGA